MPANEYRKILHNKLMYLKDRSFDNAEELLSGQLKLDSNKKPVFMLRPSSVSRESESTGTDPLLERNAAALGQRLAKSKDEGGGHVFTISALVPNKHPVNLRCFQDESGISVIYKSKTLPWDGFDPATQKWGNLDALIQDFEKHGFVSAVPMEKIKELEKQAEALGIKAKKVEQSPYSNTDLTGISNYAVVDAMQLVIAQAIKANITIIDPRIEMRSNLKKLEQASSLDTEPKEARETAELQLKDKRPGSFIIRPSNQGDMSKNFFAVTYINNQNQPVHLLGAIGVSGYVFGNKQTVLDSPEALLKEIQNQIAVQLAKPVPAVPTAPKVSPIYAAAPKTPSKKTVLFDFDDTLVNGHFHNALAQQDEQIRADNIRAGKKGAAIDEGTFHDLAKTPEGQKQQLERIQKLIATMGIKNKEALKETIENLILEGHNVGIVSYTQYPEVVLPTLKAIGLSDAAIKHFQQKGHIVGWLPADQQQGKGQHIKEALADMGGSEEDVILVDDSVNNITKAQAANIVAIQVPQEHIAGEAIPGKEHHNYLDEVQRLTGLKIREIRETRAKPEAILAQLTAENFSMTATRESGEQDLRKIADVDYPYRLRKTSQNKSFQIGPPLIRGNGQISIDVKRPDNIVKNYLIEITNDGRFRVTKTSTPLEVVTFDTLKEAIELWRTSTKNGYILAQAAAAMPTHSIAAPTQPKIVTAQTVVVPIQPSVPAEPKAAPVVPAQPRAAPVVPAQPRTAPVVPAQPRTAPVVPAQPIGLPTTPAPLVFGGVTAKASVTNAQLLRLIADPKTTKQEVQSFIKNNHFSDKQLQNPQNISLDDAVRKGNPEVVKYLIEQGVQPKFGWDKKPVSPVSMGVIPETIQEISFNRHSPAMTRVVEDHIKKLQTPRQGPTVP